MNLENSMQDEHTKNIDLAQGVFEQLKDISENGVHEAYAGFLDSLPDLWADLPWDYEGSRVAQAYIVGHSEFYSIAMKILNNYETNMLTFFGKSINFIDKELAK